MQLTSLLSLAKTYLDKYQTIWEVDSLENIEKCKAKLLELADALMDQYHTVTSVNERIRILETLEEISLAVEYNDSDFALEKAAELEDLPDLTYTQRLRLSWIPDINPDDVSEIVDEILSRPVDEFDIETLLQIINYCTDEDRTRINRLISTNTTPILS